MKIKKASNKSYTLKDIEKLLAPKDKEYCFRILSVVLTINYNEDYQRYANQVQLIPAVINSFLLYANGAETDVSQEEFDKLLMMLTSLDVERSTLTGKAIIYQSYLKVLRNVESVPFVLGRIGYIFDWLKEHKSKLEFKEVTNVNLEDFLLIFWGAFSMNDSGKKLAIIDPRSFFSSMKSTPEEIDFIVKNIEENFSITIDDAVMDIHKRIKDKNKVFDSFYTSLADKPFLKVGDVYLLVVPHFAINNLISICSRFFISQYSQSDNNVASTYYGQAFEAYCNSLIQSCIKGLELEPHYNNKPNEKGPDAILIKKNSIPIIFEYHKTTVYQSVFHDFSMKGYEDFLKEKVIKKFEQIFKWMRSYDYKYNSVNLWDELNRIQLVVVIAQPLPLTCFEDIQNLILERINEKWMEITEQTSKLLSFKNIYILGVNELELLVGSCNLKKEHLPLKLFEYKKYLKKTPDLKASSISSEMILRDEFTPWLMQDVDYKDLIVDINKEHNKKIFKMMLSRIKVDESILAETFKKLDDADKPIVD